MGRQINLLAHTGSLLLYSSILAYLIYRRFGCYQPGAIGRILDGTLRRVLPSSVSIVSMISLALVMEHAGMTYALAQGLADGFGRFFPLAAPWIGAIGALITGSNTNSNVVFGALQLQTARLLGQPEAVILAAQTAGAALASIAAPAKVVVGCSTAGMVGREGEVLRRLAGYAAVLILMISLLAAGFRRSALAASRTSFSSQHDGHHRPVPRFNCSQRERSPVAAELERRKRPQ